MRACLVVAMGVLVLSACTVAEDATPKAVVARYDAAGQALAAFKLEGVTIEALAADPTDGLIVAGELRTGPSDATSPRKLMFGSVEVTPSGKDLDAFVAKLDLLGNVVWVQRGAGAEESHALSLAVDAAGEVIVGGSFTKSVTFGATTLTSTASDFVNAIADAFVARLGADGTVVWAQRPDMNLGGEIDKLAFDPLGNITGAGRVFPTGVIVGKLDGLGNPLAVVPIKKDLSSLNNGVTSLAVDKLGNTVVAGFDDAGGFLIKIDPMGMPVWNKDPVTQKGRADVASVLFEADGTLLVAGNIDAGSVLEGQVVAEHSLFFARYDSTAAGTLAALTLTGSKEGGAFYEMHAVPGGNRFLTGDSLGAWTTATGEAVPAGHFLAGCDSAGKVLWARVPILDLSMGYEDGSLRPLAVDNAGNPVLAGSYLRQASFDNITLQ